MKKIILLLTIIFVVKITLYADPITEMEKWKAEKLLSYLENEKYLITYCDCCDKDKAELIAIDKVSIEPANATEYSVRVRGRIQYTIDMNNTGSYEKIEEKIQVFNELISLNYTFIFHENRGHAIQEVMKLEESACKEFIDFPNPNSFSITKTNIDYINWYNSTITSDQSEQKIIGSWYLRYRIRDGVNRFKEEPDANYRYNFKNDASFFNNFGNGVTGKWKILNGSIICLNDEDKSEIKLPFVITNDKLYLKTLNKEEEFELLILEREKYKSLYSNEYQVKKPDNEIILNATNIVGKWKSNNCDYRLLSDGKIIIDWFNRSKSTYGIWSITDGYFYVKYDESPVYMVYKMLNYTKITMTYQSTGGDQTIYNASRIE